MTTPAVLPDSQLKLSKVTVTFKNEILRPTVVKCDDIRADLGFIRFIQRTPDGKGVVRIVEYAAEEIFSIEREFEQLAAAAAQ